MYNYVTFLFDLAGNIFYAEEIYYLSSPHQLGDYRASMGIANSNTLMNVEVRRMNARAHFLFRLATVCVAIVVKDLECNVKS